MADFKVNKPVASVLAGTSASIGTFPIPTPNGNPVSPAYSNVGITFVTLSNADGSFGVTVGQDQTTASVAFPVGTYINTIFRAALPTYANGDAGILHIDSRGRLLTSTINPGSGGSASIDDAGSPASVPVIGGYSLYNFFTTLPTYANGDAVCPQADSRGRLIITQSDPTTGVVTDVTQEAVTAPVAPIGTWGMGVYRATLPTYADGDASIFHTSINGELLVSQAAPATSSVTSVAGSAANVTLLAANPSRKVATIFNENTTANLFVKLGAGASLTSYTVEIGPGGYYEVPNPVYTGIIDGIWDAAAGSARITEITP